MNDSDVDRRLKDLFGELRRQDAEAAPPYERLAGVRRPAARFSVRWVRLAAAAAVLVALGVAPAFLQREKPATTEVDLERWAALSNWQASTDSLLTISSTPWGSTIKTPTDSWISSGSSVTSATQETESGNGV